MLNAVTIFFQTNAYIYNMRRTMASRFSNPWVLFVFVFVILSVYYCCSSNAATLPFAFQLRLTAPQREYLSQHFLTETTTTPTYLRVDGARKAPTYLPIYPRVTSKLGNWPAAYPTVTDFPVYVYFDAFWLAAAIIQQITLRLFLIPTFFFLSSVHPHSNLSLSLSPVLPYAVNTFEFLIKRCQFLFFTYVRMIICC